MCTLGSKIIGPVFMHSKGLVHRDVKPENILLTSRGVPKLADYGTTIRINQATAGGQVFFAGTKYYMPPDRFLTFLGMENQMFGLWESPLTSLATNITPFVLLGDFRSYATFKVFFEATREEQAQLQREFMRRKDFDSLELCSPRVIWAAYKTWC